LTKAIRRFEESIAGRAYQFEVASVDPDRWRACIVKAPGVPTALMPFYGPTADEAAELLRQWLIRAHARAAQSVRASDFRPIPK
jgi:hypothetical protein